MCKHICVPVHTCGGVDHQDPAASEGQGMSLLKAWRVQVCFISLDSIQPLGTPTPPVGVYTVGPWGPALPESAQDTMAPTPWPSHGAEGGLFPVWTGPPASVWTAAFC